MASLVSSLGIFIISVRFPPEVRFTSAGVLAVGSSFALSKGSHCHVRANQAHFVSCSAPYDAFRDLSAHCDTLVIWSARVLAPSIEFRSSSNSPA